MTEVVHLSSIVLGAVLETYPAVDARLAAVTVDAVILSNAWCLGAPAGSWTISVREAMPRGFEINASRSLLESLIGRVHYLISFTEEANALRFAWSLADTYGVELIDWRHRYPDDPGGGYVA